jgi:hypothetical protein
VTHWSFVLAAVSLYVTWLLGEKKTWGWLLAAVLQILWVGYALVTVQYGFVASSLIFLVLNSRNYVKWRRNDRERKERGEAATRAM